MESSEISLALFPLGIGEEDVVMHGEAPVVVTAAVATAVPATVSVGAGHTAISTAAHHHLFASSSPQPLQDGSQGVSLGSHASIIATGVVASLTASSAPATTVDAAASTPAKALCRSHYAAVSHLCEVQFGAPLARCLPTKPSAPHRRLIDPYTACIHLSGNRRCYYTAPVEDNRYVAAVTLPATVWDVLSSGMGAAWAHALLHSSLTGSHLPLQGVRKGTTRQDGKREARAYTPLQERLSHDAASVQRAMTAQVTALAEVARGVLHEPTRWAPRVAALQRLCLDSPSPLRTHPRLGQQVGHLLQRATSASAAASVRGGLATMGLVEGEHRYVVRASAVWYRGHPLCTSLSVQQQQQQQSTSASPQGDVGQLRAAALSVLLEELKGLTRQTEGLAYADGHDALVGLTTQCCAMSPLVYTAGAAGFRRGPSGYVCQPTQMLGLRAKPHADPNASPATTAQLFPPNVSMAVTSTSGWTAAVLLQPIDAPYVGSPLSIILAGLRTVVTEEFESEPFFSAVRDATSAMRGAWRRPVQLLSPLAAQLQEAVTFFQVRRRLPNTAGLPDALLFSVSGAAQSTQSSKPHASVSDSRLHDVQHAIKHEKRRTAALLAERAAVQRRRCLTDGIVSPAHLTAERSATERRALGAGVEGAVQAAMRYTLLLSRLQRCGRVGLVANTVQSRRSQSVFAQVTSSTTLLLVEATPHSCSVAGNVRHAVVYVVVALDKKKVPVAAHEAFRAFTSWIASRSR